MFDTIKVTLEKFMFSEQENQCGFCLTEASGWRAGWKKLPQAELHWEGLGSGLSVFESSLEERCDQVKW